MSRLITKVKRLCFLLMALGTAFVFFEPSAAAPYRDPFCRKPDLDEFTENLNDTSKDYRDQVQMRAYYEDLMSSTPRQYFRMFKNDLGQYSWLWRDDTDGDHDYSRVHEIPVGSIAVDSIVKHSQDILDNGWGEYIFLPDFGHGHLFMPNWYDTSELGDRWEPYTKVNYTRAALNSNYLVVLYHTAEFLDFYSGLYDEDRDEYPPVTDPYLVFRMLSRHILGSVEEDPETKLIRLDESDYFGVEVSVGDEHESSPNGNYQIRSHNEFGAFNIRAHRDGCFEVENRSGEKVYFDIIQVIPNT